MVSHKTMFRWLRILILPRNATNSPVAVDADLDWSPGQIRKRLRLIHSNLGHPSKSVLMRLLKEAKASQDVLAEAEKFECDFCQNRGHANMHAPSAVIRNHDVWECMSVDTFGGITPTKPPRIFFGVYYWDQFSGRRE